MLGAHSLVWDEAQKIAGKDPDFHRRNLAESINMGIFPEWEFGVQIFTEAEAAKYDFDVLDATKLIPEDLVPVRRIGKMTLNRNPDNYFSETEQVAFMTTNIVPGLDFSDDPLLQGRNFSHLDTQIGRLGSHNWTQLPINRPLAPVSNNQRDSHMRYTINPGKVSYEPNSLQGNIPNQVPEAQGGFVTYPERVSGPKVRHRSPTFGDHYGQARLFWNSVLAVEREHITKALQFELSKVLTREVRLRMLGHLQRINDVLAAQVARALGEPVHASHATAMPDGTADAAAETAVLKGATSPISASGGLQHTKGLSQSMGQPQTAKGRKVAILAADSVDAALTAALKAAGAAGVVVGTHLGSLGNGGGSDDDLRQHRLGAVRCGVRAGWRAERQGAGPARGCAHLRRRGVQARQADRGGGRRGGGADRLGYRSGDPSRRRGQCRRARGPGAGHDRRGAEPLGGRVGEARQRRRGHGTGRVRDYRGQGQRPQRRGGAVHLRLRAPPLLGQAGPGKHDPPSRSGGSCRRDPPLRGEPTTRVPRQGAAAPASRCRRDEKGRREDTMGRGHDYVRTRRGLLNGAAGTGAGLATGSFADILDTGAARAAGISG